MKSKKEMARKKEERREDVSEEDLSPEQMGVDEEGQPELSLKQSKKDPTEVEFKHSYVVETPEEYGKSKEGKLRKGKSSKDSQEISDKERDEDFWYVG